MPEKPVISIVDDDPSVREGTMDLLNSMGFIAEPFQRADDFLKSNCLHSTSCLIADMRMPGMTGLELYNRLVGSGNVIPTILITAFPNDRDRSRALQAGVRCYLTKPFNEDDLVACIRSALEYRGRVGGDHDNCRINASPTLSLGRRTPAASNPFLPSSRVRGPRREPTDRPAIVDGSRSDQWLCRERDLV